LVDLTPTHQFDIPGRTVEAVRVSLTEAGFTRWNLPAAKNSAFDENESSATGLSVSRTGTTWEDYLYTAMFLV
jgi:hypothetical protein